MKRSWYFRGNVLRLFRLLWRAIILLPQRLLSLLNLLSFRDKGFLLAYPAGRERSLFWWLEVLNQLIECTGLQEVYDGLSAIIKNARPLQPEELTLGRQIYGDSINWSLVRIDEHARLGPRVYRYWYVSFYTINGWGRMSADLYVHELIHIWQYERVGGRYTVRALHAMHRGAGYDYGGVEVLQELQQQQQSIWALNYEQMGDVVADYLRITQQAPTAWGRSTKADPAVYEYFLQQIKEKKRPANQPNPM